MRFLTPHTSSWFYWTIHKFCQLMLPDTTIYNTTCYTSSKSGKRAGQTTCTLVRWDAVHSRDDCRGERRVGILTRSRLVRFKFEFRSDWMVISNNWHPMDWRKKSRWWLLDTPGGRTGTILLNCLSKCVRAPVQVMHVTIITEQYSDQTNQKFSDI